MTALEPPKSGAQAIERAVSVLLCFERSAELGISEIAASTGLTVSTAHRIVRALRQAGLVEQDVRSDRYHLGARIAVLGRLAQERLHFGLALPVAEALAADTGEAVNVGVRAGYESLIVLHVPSAHALRVVQHPGLRTPLHACAMGKTFLAFGSNDLPAGQLRRATDKTITSPGQLAEELSRVRRNGYAVNDEEWTEGVRAVAAPVYDTTGQIVAAIALQAPAQRLPQRRRQQMARRVMDAAGSMTAAMYGDRHAGRGGPAPS